MTENKRDEWRKFKTGEIYNGDNTIMTDFIQSDSVDLVVTSPPYDNLRTYNSCSDLWTFDKFKKLVPKLYRVMKPGGVIVWIVNDATVNGSETGTSFKQALYFKESGFNLADTMIYEQTGTGAKGSNKLYFQNFEYMFIFSKGKHKTFNLIKDVKNKRHGAICTRGRLHKDGSVKDSVSRIVPEFSRRSNIWRYHAGNNGDYKSGHPAVFPEKLVKDHIITWSNENDIVFDPFMGSGTVAQKAIELNRRWIGIEYNREYFENSIVRINKTYDRE